MSTISTSILNNIDSIAVLTAGLFTGTAFYVSIGQVPALREFGLNEHWRFFPYMYEKAAIPQAIFAAIAGTASIAHSTRIVGAPFDRNLWIATGSTFLAIIPFTLIFMGPGIRTIIDDNKSVRLGSQSSINIGQKKELLDKWTILHLVRTVGSVASFSAMVFGLSRHSSLILKL